MGQSLVTSPNTFISDYIQRSIKSSPASSNPLVTSDLLELHQGLVGNHGVVQLLHVLAHVCLGQQGFGKLGDRVRDQRGSSWGLENGDHRGRGGLGREVMDNWSEGL